MALRVPGRAWPLPPQGEGDASRLRGAPRRAQAPAEAFVLDLEPIEGELPPRPALARGDGPGASLPHRGRLIDIQV